MEDFTVDDSQHTNPRTESSIRQERLQTLIGSSQETDFDEEPNRNEQSPNSKPAIALLLALVFAAGVFVGVNERGDQADAGIENGAVDKYSSDGIIRQVHANAVNPDFVGRYRIVGDVVQIGDSSGYFPMSSTTEAGYLVVEFAIQENGVVTDTLVVESHPPGVFDRTALNAISVAFR